MEIEKVQSLLKEIALAHPKPGDSEELVATRKVALALMHIAQGIEDIRQEQATMILSGR